MSIVLRQPTMIGLRNRPTQITTVCFESSGGKSGGHGDAEQVLEEDLNETMTPTDKLDTGGGGERTHDVLNNMGPRIKRREDAPQS